MGKISDAMQDVVDEIRSSAEARGTTLQRVSQETNQLMRDAENLLKDIHNASQSQAKALRERLSSERERISSQEKARVKATREFMEGVRKKLNEVSIKVSEMRSDIQSLMERFRLEHADMAKDLRENLSSERQAIVQATQVIVQDAQELMREITSDLGQAHRIWMEGGRKKTIPGIAVKKAVKEIEKKPKTQEQKIMEVITGHRDGIKLVDIGNELGVDWRTLIGSVKSIVDAAKVEKIDNVYYPR
jgi:ElaB/YqjD/DUF883 family membrane-anchored ribosome-binding protein